MSDRWDALCECGCGQATALARDTDSRRGYVRGQPLRFRKGHRARVVPDPVSRFRAMVETSGDCWIWTGGKGAYGIFVIRKPVRVLAHRFAYELAYGPIPPGLQIDHLCLNKRCVNPAHLEAVTPMENTRRYWRARRAA